MRQQRTATSHTLTRVRESFEDRPFTLEGAAALGLSRAQVRAAVAAGLLHKVRRGVYAVPQRTSPTTDAADDVVRDVRAVLTVLGELPYLVSGPAGARLLDIPLVTPAWHRPRLMRVDVLVAQSSTLHVGTRDPRARVRHVRDLPREVVEVHGIQVAPPIYVATDVVRLGFADTRGERGRALALPEALVPLDASTAMAGCRTPEEAAQLLGGLRRYFTHCPGIRAVDEYRELVDPRAESPFESWSRGHIVSAGLPMPDIQRQVQGADGRLYRVDFLWEEYGVIGEADGLAKYGADPTAIRRAHAEELQRQRALEAAGWIVVRWTWDELAKNPERVIARIDAALQRARSRRLVRSPSAYGR